MISDQKITPDRTEGLSLNRDERMPRRKPKKSQARKRFIPKVDLRRLRNITRRMRGNQPAAPDQLGERDERRFR